LGIRRISKKFKEEVSMAASEGKMTTDAIADHYGVSTNQVKRWQFRWELNKEDGSSHIRNISEEKQA
jgi:transposase-like protein